MISRYEVTLNGNPMSEINENLLILDVAYDQPKIQIDTIPMGTKDGAIVSRTYKETASVTITFELHIYDIKDRQKACQDVISWAKNGGILKTNDREGQRLVCVCEKFPAITSVKKWTDPLAITFTAFHNPYWEDEDASVLTITGKNASGQIDVPGNGGYALVTCNITAKAAITWLRVSAGGTFIELQGISIPTNGVVSIGYTNEMLTIKYGNTSLLNKRTGLSWDELSVASGRTATLSVTADNSVTAKFYVRGCWQ